MYDDTALRKIDEAVATTLVAALAGSNKGAGAIYGIASGKTQPFDLIIDVENDPSVDYFGYTDVLYTGTPDSFLFGAKKLDVAKASKGLSLRIVLNLGNAKDSGQRLSTLVHEIGVHCTLLYGAIAVLGTTWKSVADLQKMKGALATQLENGAFSADYHHLQFGRGAADDYNELKDCVVATLEGWSKGAIWKIASLVGSNKWAVLKDGFVAAAKRGETLHEKHPAVQFDDFLKSVASISKSTSEFNQHNKSAQGGLMGVLKSIFS
jgi:hypothetical protein